MMKRCIFLTFSMLILLNLKVNSQNYISLYNGGDPITLKSKLYQDVNGNIAWGTKDVFAKFYIYDLGISSTPFFRSEALNVGKISFLYTENSKNYGIVQEGENLINSFRSPLYVGDFARSTGSVYTYQSTIFTNILSYDFIYNNNSQNPPKPLSISETGITVTNFRLTNNAGDGKILVSDLNGNGIWSDPGTIGGGGADDDWFSTVPDNVPPDPPSVMPNLYLNPKYGRVGVGTDNPKSKLHVQGGNLLLANPALTSPASLIFAVDYSTSTPGEWGIQYMQPNQYDHTTGGLNFTRIVAPASPEIDYCLFIRNDGKVGIGTPQPQSELSVNGKITAKEIEVLETGWFPDYVFNHDYKLRSLEEVESYINDNHHLPEMPSACEVEEKGMNLGEMNNVLVKKVEELTLYVIELKKEIDKLKSEKK